jgi:uncharacterized RDD family membrane protein YckC
MSQTDPYAPPKSSLGGPTPAQQQERDSGVLRYSTFWQRVGATLIDALIFGVPLIALEYFLGGVSRLYPLYETLATELLSAYVFIYMVLRNGGSPGKLLLGLRIARLDGSPVSLKMALLRYVMGWALTVWSSVLTIGAALSMSDQTYKALGYLERSDALDALAPMSEIVTWLTVAWAVACMITMLMNPKRRTLHDYLAGTVVVCKT